MSDSYVCSASGLLKRVLLCPPEYLSLSPINKIANDWLERGEALNRERCSIEHQALIDIYEK